MLKTGLFFKKEMMDKSRKTKDFKLTCGGHVTPCCFSEIHCDVHSHLRLKADNKNS